MFEIGKYKNDVFIVAEVGQNHQGDPKIAMDYVEKFAMLGADAIKFQTRNNKYLFDTESYDAIYNSENAFATTYGAHREFLELDKTDVKAIRARCRELGVLFMSTPFDEPSLEFLVEIEVDVMKVASFDLGNLPFLERMVKSKVPIVISCGGGNSEHVDQTISFLQSRGADFSVLHCVSKYPCSADELGLKQIGYLKERYPNVLVGLSDHFSGVVSGPVGFMSGARVFEKHVTFDRSLKGTDHGFALGPRGFEQFVRDIKRAAQMDQELDFSNVGNEDVFKKLGKSVAALSNLKAGEAISLKNIRGKIFASNGIPVRDTFKILGKTLNCDLADGQKIEQRMLNDY